MDLLHNIKTFKKKLGKSLRKNRDQSIDPDEIFIDSHNLPEFNTDQFEGRFEKPIGRRTALAVGIFFTIVLIAFSTRLWYLQINQGKVFAARSATNSLHDALVFSDRGVIYDRNNVLLAWNVDNPNDPDFALRQYATSTGLSNVIGYIKYPSKDSSGFYYRDDYVGMDGVEKYYNQQLSGQNGLKITETDAFGNLVSGSVLNPPQSGQSLTLSIDSRLQSELYGDIQAAAGEYNFTGGAGVIMDVHTGEVVADVSFPDYQSQILTDGTDTAAINNYFRDPETPLLDRVTSGLYAPGSIVKPVMALGALDTGTITADKVLYTNGSISVPNPYDPAHPSVFHDWQNNGALDMRKAIQESSDVYFYEVGGGYADQPGMGIANIDKYAAMFGYGQAISQGFFANPQDAGTVPSPAWKAANFDGESWRLGDTYHSVIGQYGWQVTPIQVVRAMGAIANYGTLLEPTIVAGDTSLLKDAKKINLPKSDFDVVQQGMRQSAEMGTGAALDIPGTEFATKTGTAQIGPNNEYYNSWIAGFFPYQDPKYSFAIVMEHGPAGNLFGAPYVSRIFFDWVIQHAPEYTDVAP